jgi:hypothetical protein
MRKISEITINGKALQDILDAHKIWRYTDAIEGRAYLRDADLRDAILSGANLSGADLSGANLSDAILSRADLSGANLSGAILSGANLSDAILSRAILSGANLSGADLRGAVLSGANLRSAILSRAILSGANLSDANLSGANLRGAVLSGADLRGAVLSGVQNIPDYVQAVTSILPDGPIIGWKKCNDRIIVKLQIPAKAKRSNATGRKCRAEFVKVLALYDSASTTELAEDAVAVTSAHGPRTEYQKGKVVKSDEWDDDRWTECSHGIHFWITRLEAELWV